MHQAKAKKIVLDYANSTLDKSDLKSGVVKPITIDDVYVVWFSYTLGNWKALLSTTLPDLKYYEVTHKAEHDGSDGPAETYLDVYVKVHNETISDVQATPVVAGEKAHEINDKSE